MGTADRPSAFNAQLRLLGRERTAGGVLWHGGISFGGVISFIFADLIILLILNIYRKYLVEPR